MGVYRYEFCLLEAPAAASQAKTATDVAIDAILDAPSTDRSEKAPETIWQHWHEGPREKMDDFEEQGNTKGGRAESGGDEDERDRAIIEAALRRIGNRAQQRAALEAAFASAPTEGGFGGAEAAKATAAAAAAAAAASTAANGSDLHEDIADSAASTAAATAAAAARWARYRRSTQHAPTAAAAQTVGRQEGYSIRLMSVHQRQVPSLMLRFPRSQPESQEDSSSADGSR